MFLFSITEAVSLTQGSNILGDLSTALNRLQTTILEGNEVVADARKRNTILTLVAWLKRILQTSTNDSNATCSEAQLFALTDLLPTELLLTKLMPQLGDVNENVQIDDRSPASAKRFSRQRNNRFNTIGVSKEEIADARLYLQKKLLSENLASTTVKSSEVDQQETILNDSDNNRRKSLNLSQSKNLDKNIESILKNSKNSFSKSVDIELSDESYSFHDSQSKLTRATEVNKAFNTKAETEHTAQNHSKVVLRKKSNSNSHTSHRQYVQADREQNESTDSDDDHPNVPQRKSSIGSSTKQMNKFALRKMKMKRANTIDVPKNNVEDFQSDHGQSDGSKNGMKVDTNNYNVHRKIEPNVGGEVSKDHLPDFQIKSPHDKKFYALLNRNNEQNRPSWLNPNKSALLSSHNQNQKQIQHMNQSSHQDARRNWTNKFGSIKSTFEQFESPVSPRLSKKNNFTHAPTSPFKPVQNNKPPLVPNGGYLYHNNNQQVLRKIAAIQSNESKEQIPNQSINRKIPLKTHQSFPIYADDRISPNSPHLKSKDWQQHKYSSVDNNLNSTNYNPLYVPLNKPSNRMMQSKPSASPLKTPVSPESVEFPSYTFTSTDYTQPACVSTFGPESITSPQITSPQIASPLIKTTILPDTSYLKSTEPPKLKAPPFGSNALNMQMKTFETHSSSEYLSEPNHYFRSPQPFSPTYDQNYAHSYHSQPESQEFTAKSQIMQYPQTQTAAYVIKTKRYDDAEDRQTRSSQSHLMNHHVRGERKYSETYSEKNSSVSPFSDINFSQINQTYVPPVEIPPQTVVNRTKPVSNFMSMENISSKKIDSTEQAAPIRLRNNTAYYGSHAALTSSQNLKNRFKDESIAVQKPFDNIKPKAIATATATATATAPVKLNNYGGHYIQPKVDNSFDKSGPTYGKTSAKDNAKTDVIKNNVTNLNRSQTITHQRISNYEIKRKQSLPEQSRDYSNHVSHSNESNLPPTHSYLPSGVLKRSKSSHTIALLQQFENKGKSQDIQESAPLPPYIKKPILNATPIQTKPKPPVEILNDIKPKPIVIENEIKPKPITVKQIKETQSTTIASKTFVESGFESKSVAVERPKRDITAVNQQINFTKSTNANANAVKSKTIADQLEPPAINETPASPSVEDGHIVFPGQTIETRNRVQHYAQTLNAMLNRKSIILDDDDDGESDKNDFSSAKGGVLQKSKSGTLLSVPKQYESAIKKSEVEEKQRTVAAYFSGNKSPSTQSLQRSSSQHSILSSSSFKSAKGESNTVSPQDDDESHKLSENTTDLTVSKSTTCTTKSSHHLKILRRQQKTSTNSPLAKSQTLPSINLLDESNVDDAFEDLFASFKV